MLALVIGYSGFSQLASVTVEEYAVGAVVGAADLTGHTQYRIFANMTDPGDAAFSVYGDINCPSDVTTTTTFYRDAFGGGVNTASGLNEAFYGLVPSLFYHSAPGIGEASNASLGVERGPLDGNGSLNPLYGATDGLISGTGNDAQTLEGPYDGTGPDNGGNDPGPSDLWISTFDGGGNIVLNSFNGGGWFTLPGAGNELGIGVNNSVFLGSFTTDGDFSYNLIVGQETAAGVPSDAVSCDGLVDNLIFPEPGCTDGTACNFNAFADVDDSSCVFATGCDVCDGMGGVTDNPEEGEACDDGDALTLNDVIQADCSCAGVAPSGPANDLCANAEALTIDGGLVAGDNTDAADENGPDEVEAIDPACWGLDGTDGDVWYSLVGTGARVDIETSGLDTQIAVYDACGGNLVACDDDSGTAFASLIEGFCTEVGTTYVIEVEGYDSAAGAFNIEVRTAAQANVTYCSDINASNYQDPAGFDSCDIEDNTTCEFIGCTTAGAINFDPNATTDDGSCVVPGCADAPITYTSCYDSGEITSVTFLENNPGEGVTIQINAGSTENNFDEFYVYDGADNTATQLNVDVYGDQSGNIFQSTGASLTLEIDADGSVSCVSGSQTAFDISVYCADVAGCTDNTAVNFNGDAVNDDGSCEFDVLGCTNASALNFDGSATLDDGSCIVPGCADAPITYTSCYDSGEITSVTFLENNPGEGVTILINAGDTETNFDEFYVYDGADNTATQLNVDEYGDQTGNVFQSTGASLTIEIDADGSVSCVSGSQTAFDISVYCADVAGCTDNTASNFDGDAVNDDGSCIFGVVGCNDITANNYDAAADDCNGVIGGTDTSCCIFPPANDMCMNAVALTVDGGLTAGTNVGANDENGPDEVEAIDPTCWGLDGTDGDVWYSLVGTDAIVDIETSGLDTQIAVYDACGGTLVACDDDGGTAFASLIEGFCAEAGTTYVIEVEGYNSTEGAFDIEVRTSAVGPATVCNDPLATNFVDATSCDIVDNSTCVYPAVPGDLQSDPVLLSMTAWPVCGSVSGDNTLATDSPESTATDLDIWYEVVPSRSGMKVECSDDDADFDAVIRVYDSSLTQIGFADSFGSGATEEAFVAVTSGDTYYINISGWNGDTGTYDVCAQNLPQNSVSSPQHDASFACTAPTSVSSAWLPADGTVWYFNNGVDPEIVYSSSVQTIDLVADAGLDYGSYDVHVNSIIEGFEVPFTFETTLTLEEPGTNLENVYNGATVDLIPNAFVKANGAGTCGAESFVWRITDSEGTESIIPTATRVLLLEAIPGVTYEEEYTSEVAVVIGGETYSYGEARSFNTGSVPLTKVNAIYNSSNTSLSLTSNIWGQSAIVGADSYSFEVTRTDITELPFTYNNGNPQRVAGVDDIPLQEGGTYNIRMKAEVAGFTTMFGAVEEVTVIGGAPVVNSNDDNTPIALDDSAVKDEVITAGVKMYPNPTTDFVTLNITGIEEGTDKVLVDIFNSVGQLVQSEQLAADGNYVNSVVALDGLAEGMYNVQITVGNTVTTERMIVQK